MLFTENLHTHSYINYFSSHPPSQKRGVVFGQALRAFRVSSPEFLQQELDIIYSAFSSLGYPKFVIRGAISEAKTKYLTSGTASRQPTTETEFITLSFPFHTELESLNASIRASKHRIVFTSSNSIGRAVVSKRGSQVAATYQRSGVYAIDCLTPDCQLTYYGRSMELDTRIASHAKDYRTNLQSSALVKHVQDFPGHSFNPGNTRLIWATRDLYQSQLLEASCIKLFPSCNRGPGDITISQTFAAVCMYLAGYRGNKDHPTHRTDSARMNPVNDSATAPVQQLLDAPTDAPNSNNISNSTTSIMTSQPMPRRVTTIRQEERSSSQPVSRNHILHSPRRMRSTEGVVNRYRMRYRGQGFEMS